jgi:hypothetical protein
MALINWCAPLEAGFREDLKVEPWVWKGVYRERVIARLFHHSGLTLIVSQRTKLGAIEMAIDGGVLDLSNIVSLWFLRICSPMFDEARGITSAAISRRTLSRIFVYTNQRSKGALEEVQQRYMECWVERLADSWGFE